MRELLEWCVFVSRDESIGTILELHMGMLVTKPIPPNPQGVLVLSMSFSLYLSLALSFVFNFLSFQKCLLCNDKLTYGAENTQSHVTVLTQ